MVRLLLEDDAPAYLALLRQIDEETSFLMWEPGERTLSGAALRARLVSRDLGERIQLVAEDDGSLVGFLAGVRGGPRRIRHRADLAMGVLRQARGRGAGSKLLEAFEAWAVEYGIWRLELTVMAHNERAIRLYESFGFSREGVKRKAIVVDGAAVDEIVMGRLLN